MRTISNLRFIKFMLFVIMSSVHIHAVAQEYVIANLEKSGTLKKNLKQQDIKDFSTVTSLKISGLFNGKDWKLLDEFSNLRCLNLEEVIWDGNTKLKALNLNVTELHLPNSTDSEAQDVIVVNSCPKTEILSYSRYYDWNIPSNLRKVVTVKSAIDSYAFSIHEEETRVPIDTLIVTDVTDSEIYESRCVFKGGLVPRIIICKDGNKVLNRCKVIETPKDLDGINVLPKHWESNMHGTWILNNELKKIGSRPYQDSIGITAIHTNETDVPLLVRNEAFHGEKISKIHFKRPVVLESRAFVDCTVDTIIFEKGADLGYASLPVSNVVVFKTTPTFSRKFAEGALKKRSQIIVPERSDIAMYTNCGVPAHQIIVPPKKLVYNIHIEKPGTILSHLSLDKLEDIDSLTIKGVLYETDLRIVRECRYLRYLDLSQSFPMNSPEKGKEESSDLEALNFVFSLMGAAAKSQHQDGKMTTMDYNMVKTTSDLIKLTTELEMMENDASDSVVGKADKRCEIPSNAFYGMPMLEHVKLPYYMAGLYQYTFSNCPNLRRVELPPYLEYIGKECFSGCYSLKNIDFPTTVTQIQKKAFEDSSLEEVDLSKCDFKNNDFDVAMFNFATLSSLKLPNNINELYMSNYKILSNAYIYMPEELAHIGCRFNKCKLFFQSVKPIRMSGYQNLGNDNTIFIPKGSITSFYTAYGEGNKYVEIGE